MFKKIIDFYKVSEPIPAKASTPEENERKLKRLKQFLLMAMLLFTLAPLQVSAKENIDVKEILWRFLPRSAPG